MGVKNLWDILESCKKKLPLHHLQNKKVCVDLSCWLVQLQTAHRSPAFAKEKVYLKNLFHRIRALLALNCSLIFVTDGAIPSVKLSTYRRRLGSSSEAAREEVNSQPIPSLPRNMGSGFSCMIKEAKHLGMALGIPCLDGVEEAEAQCALLNSASLCDGCFTSDSDIFLFGARTVYRDVFIGEGGYVICYEMADIEKKLGFGRNSLISLALLLGSDYSNGVYGFGPETACRLVKSVGDDCILDQILSGGVKATRRCKGKDTSNNMSKVGDVCLKSTCEPGTSQDSSGQFLEVINAYLKPKCHLPDSEHAQRVCSIQPFLRSQLQQICEQYFGWSSEKTDQYILPKIAERELRRFSNFRSASSALEIKPLLNEIPVPCPVAAIVKQRKVQGSEYYEVSWRNIDGLQVSVVPGDLVRSACPEKITEFLENKGEEKKQKRIARPKKSTQAAVKDVDVQLQELLLGIELESSTLSSTTNCPQEVHVYNGAPGKDIVDLSSPSPPSRACKLAKSQKFTDSTTAVTNGISQSLLPSMELPSSNLSGDIQNPTPDNHPIDLSSPLPPIAHKPWNTRGLPVDVKAERSALSDVSKFPQKESILSGAPFECKADANGDDWQLQAPSYSSGTESSHQSGTPESSWRSNTGNLVAETDTVDLSSPSPLVGECKLVKCDKMSNQNVDVIDLCDDSPEHERKARELRLFLDSIRDDLY